MTNKTFALFLLVLTAGGRLAAQNRPLVMDPAWIAKVKPIDVILAKDKKDLTDRDAKGPSGPPIDLGALTPLDGLDGFPDVERLQDLSNLSLKVYADANSESNIYYYYPAGYFLGWDLDRRYHLSLDYKFARDDGENVLIDARLSPGRVERDRELIRQLLSAHLRRSRDRELRARANHIQLFELPARYEVETDLSQLGAANLTVPGIDEVTREIALTIATDAPTRELLVKKLSDGLGVSGRVRILPEAVSPDTPALSPFLVSARLLLTDPAYASTPWQRSAGREFSEFRNVHDFPVRLRYLCYLYRGRRGLEVRGYRLGDSILGPADVARLPNTRITNQIDDSESVLRAWYVYSLVNDEDTRANVIARLTGGVSNVPVKQVAVEVVQPNALFEQYSLHKIVVLIRSRQFDPDGVELIEHGHELTLEASRVELAPLYLSDGAELSYEYRLGVVTTTGEQLVETTWRGPSVLGDITIGSTQIEGVLGQ